VDEFEGINCEKRFRHNFQAASFLSKRRTIVNADHEFRRSDSSGNQREWGRTLGRAGGLPKRFAANSPRFTHSGTFNTTKPLDYPSVDVNIDRNVAGQLGVYRGERGPFLSWRQRRRAGLLFPNLLGRPENPVSDTKSRCKFPSRRWPPSRTLSEFPSHRAPLLILLLGDVAFR